MSNEASKTRAKFGYLEKRIFCGRGIDIGSGNDPIYPDALAFDLAQGDANEITKFVKEKFNYVFSAHCLEHMRDPYKALGEWWRLLKPGGYLYLVVPDEDLYEQGVFPSRWNADHKHTFTVSKTASWSPVSINILDLVKKLPDAEILKIEIQDDRYDYSLHDVDQTFQDNGYDAMAQIAVILRKQRKSIPRWQAWKLRSLYLRNLFFEDCKKKLQAPFFEACKKKLRAPLAKGKRSLILAREIFFSDKYSGLSGKIDFFSKSIRIILAKIPFVRAILLNFLPLAKHLSACQRRLYASKPKRKKIFFFLPNGLGDAIINKPYIDLILKENQITADDAVILASNAWFDFKESLFPGIKIYAFDLELFEKSLLYRIKIYRLLGKYQFARAICNLKWKPDSVFRSVMAQVDADHKYGCLHNRQHIQYNCFLQNWAGHFGLELYDNGPDLHETQRLENFYTSIGLLSARPGLRPSLRRPLKAACASPARYIVFHIGNADKRRRWSIQKFNAVGRELARLGYTVIFCGGERERDLLPLIDRGFKTCIDTLSTEEYIKLISGAALMLSGDTGPAHLALALDVPTAVILGGGHYQYYFPYPENIAPPLPPLVYITKSMDCFGCDWECSKEGGLRFECIHSIESEEVCRQVRELLGQNAATEA